MYVCMCVCVCVHVLFTGEDVRYVIDFYKGAEKPGPPGPGEAPVSIYLDVRPALDSPVALKDRMYVGLQEAMGKSVDSLAQAAFRERKEKESKMTAASGTGAAADTNK